MGLMSDSFFNDKKRPINMKWFFIFLILCIFVLGSLIYVLMPGFFSRPIIERIPIIIERETDEVTNILWR